MAPVRRPLGVTVIVVLIVLAGLLNVLAGVVAFFQRNDAAFQDATSMTDGQLLWFSVGAVLIGLVYLLIARGLAQGGGFARFLVALVTVINLVVGLWVAITGGGNLRTAGLIQAAIALIILLMLYGPKANAFFRTN